VYTTLSYAANNKNKTKQQPFCKYEPQLLGPELAQTIPKGVWIQENRTQFDD